MKATGKCLCGAVQFSADGVEAHYHSCHCTMCRRWGGGPAFGVGVQSVSFEGADHIKRYQSSDWAERAFCRRCGSNLYYRLKDADHFILMAGVFDDSTNLKLTGEIFVDEKPAGYDFAGDHPRLTGEEFLASFQQGEDG